MKTRWVVLVLVIIVAVVAAMFAFLHLNTSGSTGSGTGFVPPIRLVSIDKKVIPCPCGGVTNLTTKGETGGGDSLTSGKGACASGYHVAHTTQTMKNLLGMQAVWFKVVGHWCNTFGPPMFLQNVQWTYTQDSWANITLSVDNSYVHWRNRYTGATDCKDSGNCTDVIYYKQLDVKACALVKPICVDYHPWLLLHLGEGPGHSGDWS